MVNTPSPNRGTLRAIVIDDCCDFRDLIEAYLKEIPGWTCAGSFANASDALQSFHEIAPDAAFVDLLMPDAWGAPLIRQLKEDRPETRIIVITGLPEQEAAFIAKEYGADRLVLKPFTVEDLIDALTGPRTPTFGFTKNAPADAIEALAMIDPRLVVPAFATEHALAEWNRNREVAWYWVHLAIECEFNVSKLAVLYRWHSRHLKYEWGRMFHRPAGEWLHRVRMFFAAYLLWKGQPATRVAAQLEYSDVHQLYRAFHRFFGSNTLRFVEEAHRHDWITCSKCYTCCSKSHMLASNNPATKKDVTKANLSPTEEKILQAAVQDPAVKHIADELESPINTVKTHLKRIYIKLGVHSLTEALTVRASTITQD